MSDKEGPQLQNESMETSVQSDGASIESKLHENGEDIELAVLNDDTAIIDMDKAVNHQEMIFDDTDAVDILERQSKHPSINLINPTVITKENVWEDFYPTEMNIEFIHELIKFVKTDPERFGKIKKKMEHQLKQQIWKFRVIT